MLELKNLLCVRNDRVLFKKVSCVLNKAQALQITGDNGCGKSTLLRTIAGFLRPFAGVIVGQHNDLCYVGHNLGLHPDLTVWQNLQFLQVFVRGGQQHDLRQALQYFNLQNLADVKLGELSAGCAQQLSLTRFCITSAQLWILDEPCAHLDTTATHLLQELCKRHLAREGLIVLATHSKFDLSPFTVLDLRLEQETTCCIY